MPNEQDRGQNPQTGSESDISKSQAQQQPIGQSGQKPESGERSQFETAEGSEELAGDQAATGQSQTSGSPDESLQGDTLAQQRTDVEGASLGSKESGEAESGFVGAEGQTDTSSELVEDEDFERDGQGAPEGK